MLIIVGHNIVPGTEIDWREGMRLMLAKPAFEWWPLDDDGGLEFIFPHDPSMDGGGTMMSQAVAFFEVSLGFETTQDRRTAFAAWLGGRLESAIYELRLRWFVNRYGGIDLVDQPKRARVLVLVRPLSGAAGRYLTEPVK